MLQRQLQREMSFLTKFIHIFTQSSKFLAGLLDLGVEKHLHYQAYTYLIEDAARVRSFFGYPVKEHKDYLMQMTYGL